MHSILLIEDHVDTLAVFTRLLRVWRFDVSPAGSIAAAIETFDITKHQIIISDIGLPDGTGFELMRRIRSMGFNGPSVAVTAWASADDRHHALEAGFDRFVAKPVNVAQLRTVITSVAEEVGA